MIKDLVYALGYSFFGNVALLMFFAIFLVVCFQALRTNREDSQRNSNVVLDDLEGNQS
ncbi:MAG: hypothetical protein JNL67_05880 [Planctomycetaceae bacterium]|nr:hypothetical protein [Planctomycetaceae bacterium]